MKKKKLKKKLALQEREIHALRFEIAALKRKILSKPEYNQKIQMYQGEEMIFPSGFISSIWAYGTGKSPASITLQAENHLGAIIDICQFYVQPDMVYRVPIVLHGRVTSPRIKLGLGDALIEIYSGGELS